MAVVIQRESTEYIYIGLSGTLPTTAELAFLIAGTRPTSGDWQAARIIPNNTDSQWADAVGSGATGTYFVTKLIGAFGGTGLVLAPGDFQVWIRLTGGTEQPVRIAPTAVEIA